MKDGEVSVLGGLSLINDQNSVQESLALLTSRCSDICLETEKKCTKMMTS